jgi:DNA-binding response OmpR family regulator
MGSEGPDPSIKKALVEAGCEFHGVYSVTEAFNTLWSRIGHDRTAAQAHTLLVAEVQSGAIPLLTLIRETNVPLPPTLLFDRDGKNVQTAVQALKLGANDYVLASEPKAAREVRARVLAERLMTMPGQASKNPARPAGAGPAPAAPQPKPVSNKFQWDADTNVIRFEDSYVRLTPVEGRMFAMLLAKREQTVTREELIKYALQMPNKDVDSGVRLLRPHMMRLRSKLEVHPQIARRIVNVRGGGYMLVL